MRQDWNKVKAVECLSWQYCIQQSTSSLSGSQASWREPLRYLSPFCSQHPSRGVPNQTAEWKICGGDYKAWDVFQFQLHGSRRDCSVWLTKNIQGGCFLFIYLFNFIVGQEHHTYGFGKTELRWGDFFCSRKIPNLPVCWNDIHLIYYWTITDIFCMFCFVYFLFRQNNAFNA